MKHLTTILVAAVAALTSAFSANAAVTPGKWNTNFTESLAYAEANNIPIVLVWGNTSCSYCNKLHAVLEDDAIMDWAKEHPIMMVERHEAYQEDFSKYSADHQAAYNWTKTLEDIPKSYGNPRVGVYWKKADGTVACSTGYPGRDGKMPATSGTLAQQFADSLDLLVGDYPSGSGGISFVTTDTETDRLEAESTTRTVYVPLKRDSGTKSAKCTLNVAYPTGVTKSVVVGWDLGETEQCVALDIPSGAYRLGQSISLSLANEEGKTIATSSILFVAKQENSPKNPHWVGECTYDTLPYGEWTMDFDVAKQKVAQMGGKLMVMFGGPLWCPNCVVIENDVFSTATFKSWAKSNKIVLVHFDQGQASSPATPEGTPRGRLLTTTVSTKGVSGSSYLSRHGINPDSSTVEGVIDRVTELTQKWLAPESTAARLANPVVLLLNDAGTKVDARFQRQGDSSTMDLTENMNRFNDLLLLAGADENEGYRTVTPLDLAPEATAQNTLQINASKKYYDLEGVLPGYGIEATLVADKDATLTLYTEEDGSAVTLATGTGTISYKEPLTAEQIANLSLGVTGFANAQSTFYGANTTFGFKVSYKTIEVESVVPFKSLTKAEQLLLNPELYTKQAVTVPVYEMLAGGKQLIGTLAVSVSSSNKITAKFVGDVSVSFSGTWATISRSTGTVATTLEKTYKKIPYALDLSMDSDGNFAAMLYALGAELGQGAVAAGDISSYEGSYTVALVDSAGKAGTGNLTIKVTNKGKATVKGILPDGTSLTVSATLSPNADGTATLPIYKATTKYAVSMALTIAPDAWETWGEKEVAKNTVKSVEYCAAFWETDETVQFTIEGGYWESTTPLAICETYNLLSLLGVTVGGEATEDVIEATKNGFKLQVKDILTSLSYTKSTGAFSGKAKIPVVGGKPVSATIKGVLTPGWVDCHCGDPIPERPYGSGTLYYKSGKTIVSLPIDIVATEAE